MKTLLKTSIAIIALTAAGSALAQSSPGTKSDAMTVASNYPTPAPAPGPKPTPTPAPTPTPMTTTSSIFGGTTVGFGGMVSGAGGSFDNHGNLASGSNSTFTGEFFKKGSGKSTTTLTAAGPICGPLCAVSRIDAMGTATEEGSAAVSLKTTTPGANYGLVNSGTLASAANITFGYSGPNVAPTPRPAEAPAH